MSSNFRVIGKGGFLLIVIGFLMPWVTARGFAALFGTQMNGFQLANFSFGAGHNIEGILLYLWFVFVLAGLIIGVLLLMKKNIPTFIDWLIASVCLGGSLYLVIELSSIYIIHSGPYVTIIGAVIFLVFQIVSVIKKEQ